MSIVVGVKLFIAFVIFIISLYLGEIIFTFILYSFFPSAFERYCQGWEVIEAKSEKQDGEKRLSDLVLSKKHSFLVIASLLIVLFLCNLLANLSGMPGIMDGVKITTTFLLLLIGAAFLYAVALHVTEKKS